MPYPHRSYSATEHCRYVPPCVCLLTAVRPEQMAPFAWCLPVSSTTSFVQDTMSYPCPANMYISHIYILLPCHGVQYIGMQSHQTRLVSMRRILPCTGQSVDQHKLANYYHAILSIILAQFSHKGFENGMAGTVRLAQASPYIRVRSLPYCILLFISAFCFDVTAT